jgi:hypothetical protein
VVLYEPDSSIIHLFVSKMAPAFIKRASQVQTAPSRSAKEVLTLEDEAILLEIGDDLDKASPAATKAAYGPAQREFREWCLKKAVKDGKPALEDIKDEGKRALEDTQRLVSWHTLVVIVIP